MAASKHIDLICIIVTVCALLITILFMNGQDIGIAVMADEDAGNGQFTANDLDGTWADDADDAAQIILNGDNAEIHGNGAYFYDGDVHIVYAGRYIISGQLDNGSLIIDADKDDKIWILLNGSSIRSADGAAVVVEQAEKVFLTLEEGTENVITGWADLLSETDGSDSLEDTSGSIDGAVYSRDDLTINGGGSLNVTSAWQHAIVCNDDFVVTGGRITLTSPQDGIHANDSVRIANADLTINAGDDGITASNDDDTSYFYMESGSVTIPSCYEGIEAIDVMITGGQIDIAPTDDGINASGYGSSSITIAGGDIRIVNPTGRDADGLDSNGNIYVTGGDLFISLNGNGSNCALDSGSENGGVCEISGGTVIAAGGSGMAEGFHSSSEQAFLMQTVSATSDNTEVTLKNEAGETLLSETIPCSFSSIILSTPRLQLGETCTLLIGNTETEITIDNSSSGGFEMGGRFGGMGGGIYRGGGRPDESGAAQPPDGEIPQPPDDRDSAQFPMKLRNRDNGDNPQQRNGSAQRDQARDWDDPTPAGAGAVSAETWSLIGISALCLAVGLLIAWRKKH